MSEIKDTFFFKHCQKILTRMTDEEILNVKNISCNKTRIKDLYKFSMQVELPYDFQQKDFSAAEKLKNLGNDYFKKKDNFKALECYNQGIIVCPQTDDDGKKLLSLLIANRSATFFDLKRFKKALFDIDYLKDVGAYPQELLHKIYTRQTKCFEESKDYEKAKESYGKVLEHIKVSKLTDKEKLQKIKDVEKSLAELEKHKTTNTKEVVKDKGGNSNRNLVSIQEENKLGRYAVANEDIPTGSVVLDEEPFIACVAPNFILKNCQYCMKSTKNVVACPGCNATIFCSRECKTKAQSFHQYECPILQFLATSGVSLNCLLALRMITRKPLDYFIKYQFEKLVLKNSYSSDDYNTVMNLCNHSDKRAPGQFVHYTCMVIFLVRLLKQTSYFSDKTKDEFLAENELLIANRLLEHLLILEYNAHEVSEVTVTVKEGGGQDQKTETVGGALYVNLAFFNHSCEPSIIRYNIGRRMIVKSIKPIKKGEPIYENYGPMYTRDEKGNRQQFLEARYCFTCECSACKENWPILDSMNPNMFKIACKNPLCGAIMNMHKDNPNINLKCRRCDTPNSFMNTLMKLMEMTKITKSAEDHMEEKNYKDASTDFLKALEIYYENIVPPHPDIIHLNQQLRDCLVHLGNHRDEPPFDKLFPAPEEY